MRQEFTSSENLEYLYRVEKNAVSIKPSYKHFLHYANYKISAVKYLSI